MTANEVVGGRFESAAILNSRLRLMTPRSPWNSVFLTTKVTIVEWEGQQMKMSFLLGLPNEMLAVDCVDSGE